VKKALLILFFISLAGTLSYVDAGSGGNVSGKAVFDQRGCAACHDGTKDQSVLGLGPSFQQICEAYKDSDADLNKFMKCESSPLLDKARYSTMHEQIVKIKSLSDAELKALLHYICHMK
jgi:cytochrome c551/c552